MTGLAWNRLIGMPWNPPVQLDALDLGGSTGSDIEAVTVDGQMKLGHFSMSFEEFGIPMSGPSRTIG